MQVTKRKRPAICTRGWLAIRAVELSRTNYRMLEVGESFASGDQILDTFSGDWENTNRVGQTVPDDGRWYRRKHMDNCKACGNSLEEWECDGICEGCGESEKKSPKQQSGC